MPSLFPALLAIHILLAVSLFLPSLLLPFALRRQEALSTGPGPMVAGLLWLQRTGSLAIGAGLALSGAALVLVLGTRLLQQPWLLAALAIYAIDLAVAFFVQRPGLRRLLLGDRGDDDARWRTRARRQRYISYVMAAAVGMIAFLMSTKPALW